jgi:hypothetical protein
MAKDKPISHQFSMFGFIKPKKKVPISAKAIEEAKKLHTSGNIQGSVQKMREVNDALERFLNRMK